MAIPQNVKPYSVTIPNGGSLSPQVDIGPNSLVGIAMPAAWDAAALTMKVSFDGGITFYDFAPTTFIAGSYVPVDHFQWSGIFSIKLQSGPTGGAVNQSADRTFLLVTRPLSN